jgi:hypothetical protein
MSKRTDIEKIHLSLVNGQRRQMVNQIDEYGVYDFWEDYKRYLAEAYVGIESRYSYFSDAAISYNRIK